jgi:hypothetical protein
LTGGRWHWSLGTGALSRHLGDFDTGTLSQGPCHGGLASCHRALVTRALSQRPCHRDLVIGGLCQRNLVVGTVSREPYHRDLVTGTVSQGPCHGDVGDPAKGTSLQRRQKVIGICSRKVARAEIKLARLGPRRTRRRPCKAYAGGSTDPRRTRERANSGPFAE